MWHAIRDIVVASINKGQLLVILLGAVILVVAIRLPPQKLGTLAENVIERLVKGDLWGWMLFVVVSAAWSIVSSKSRRAQKKEIDRIGSEKSKAQQRAQGKDVKSSKKR